MRISKNKIKNIVSRQYNKELKIHNRNKRITKLIKEEVARGFNEGARDDEWEMVDAVVAALGAEGALDALVRALPSSDVMDAMEYVARMHEIPMELDEETKPHEADRTQGRDVPEDRIRK
tara:strand:- start:453 stop:812 length:360 start_codon:yes stop_codon:yes gene_type:complete